LSSSVILDDARPKILGGWQQCRQTGVALSKLRDQQRQMIQEEVQDWKELSLQARVLRFEQSVIWQTVSSGFSQGWKQEVTQRERCRTTTIEPMRHSRFILKKVSRSRNEVRDSF